MEALNMFVASIVLTTGMSSPMTNVINTHDHIQYGTITTSCYKQYKPYSEKKYVYHEGGEVMNPLIIRKCIDDVLQCLDIKSTDEFKKLIYETMIVETNLGGEKWSTGISKWRNYGIGQFTMRTAKYLLSWLKKTDYEAYTALMTYYNHERSLEYNITYNVSFSVGMIAHYYLHRAPNAIDIVGNLTARAKLWKRVYNTYKGSGTVHIYKKRVIEFKKNYA